MKKTVKKLLKNYVLTLTYIILINIFLTLSIISLHELGHFFTGMYYGCKNIKIILFDLNNLSTYTEMSCDQTVSVKVIAIGPLFLVTSFGMIFFLLKQKPERFYGMMIIGLNTVIAVSDVKNIIKTPILYYVEFIIGLSLIVWAEISMVNDILSDQK